MGQPIFYAKNATLDDKKEKKAPIIREVVDSYKIEISF
jgi:hypothetical protein